ncbi:hypothetical protein [Streptomyces olivaceoviridis]|uniref:hypothetical protein n=1 Tax=Streptomyces olivaceoviridis TaxID=1921 RepID=UPI0037992CD5
MRSQRIRRLVALSASGLLLTGAAAIGTAGSAFAAEHGNLSSYSSDHGGHGWWGDDDDDSYGYGYGYGGDYGGYGGDHGGYGGGGHGGGGGGH